MLIFDGAVPLAFLEALFGWLCCPAAYQSNFEESLCGSGRIDLSRGFLANALVCKWHSFPVVTRYRGEGRS